MNSAIVGDIVTVDIQVIVSHLSRVQRTIAFSFLVGPDSLFVKIAT